MYLLSQSAALSFPLLGVSDRGAKSFSMDKKAKNHPSTDAKMHADQALAGSSRTLDSWWLSNQSRG